LLADVLIAQFQSFILQKTLKEKEEHIQQLLVERDLERSEMARMASHLDEVL
jgi:hypothetical protein